MAKPFAWSYSALNGFETCGWQHYEMRILKGKWPDPPGEVQLFGLECHKHIENRIGMGRQLPTFISHLEPIITKLETSKGVTQSEYKLALNQQFKPVEFFARDAWVRAVGDIVKVHGDKAFQLDWKFGKYREGDDQLKLQSAVAFAAMPHVNTITNVYAWVKDKRTTVRTFHREEVPMIWQEFLPRVKKMEAAVVGGQAASTDAERAKFFTKNETGLCRQYCAVLSCEFNGRR